MFRGKFFQTFNTRRLSPFCGVLVSFLLFLLPLTGFTQQTDWQPEWNEVGPYEAAATPVMLGATGGLRLLGSPHEPNWVGPILVDEPVYDSVSPIPTAQEHRSRLASDILVGATVAYPYIGDFLIAHQANKVSNKAMFQSFLITTESISAAILTTSAVKYLVGRRRPGIARECSSEDVFDCSSRENLSFPSGHTSLAFAAAFSTCVQHEHLAFLGTGSVNQVPCYLSLGAASVTGFLRINAARHYTTDVLAGAAIGFGAGYVLPKLLHFRDDETTGSVTTSSGRLTVGMGYSTPMALYSFRF